LREREREREVILAVEGPVLVQGAREGDGQMAAGGSNAFAQAPREGGGPRARWSRLAV